MFQMCKLETTYRHSALMWFPARKKVGYSIEMRRLIQPGNRSWMHQKFVQAFMIQLRFLGSTRQWGIFLSKIAFVRAYFAYF